MIRRIWSLARPTCVTFHNVLWDPCKRELNARASETRSYPIYVLQCRQDTRHPSIWKGEEKYMVKWDEFIAVGSPPSHTPMSSSHLFPFHFGGRWAFFRRCFFLFSAPLNSHSTLAGAGSIVSVGTKRAFFFGCWRKAAASSGWFVVCLTYTRKRRKKKF